jgi:hypothetical protein
MFNVNELIAEVNSKGHLRTSKFVFESPVPRGFIDNSVQGLDKIMDTGRRLKFYGESASLPGVLLASQDIRRYGYGPTEKKPFAPVFRDQMVTFRDDAAGSIWKFMTNWQRMAVLYETREEGTNSTTGSVRNQYPYEVAYKGDYAVDATVSVFDDAGNLAVKATMREAWPVYVSDVQLSWKDKNQLFHVPVVFTFFDFWNTAAPPQAT